MTGFVSIARINEHANNFDIISRYNLEHEKEEWYLSMLIYNNPYV